MIAHTISTQASKITYHLGVGGGWGGIKILYMVIKYKVTETMSKTCVSTDHEVIFKVTYPKALHCTQLHVQMRHQ